MTKNEFLNILERELGNLPGEIKADIVNDFREHFDAAMESGKDEADICGILGDPHEIAREFLTDYSNDTSEDGNVFDNAGEHGGKQARYDNEYHNARQHQQRSLDERRYRRSEEYGQELINRIAAAGIKKITVTGITCDIEICGEDTSDITLDFNGDEGRFTTAVSSDGTFLIQEKHYKQHYDGILNRINRNSQFNFSVGNIHVRGRTSTKVSVTLPWNFTGKLEVFTASGDVEAKRLSELDFINLKTASGDVEIDKIISNGEVKLSTGSGEISAESCSAAAKFGFGSGSGDISVERCAAGESFSVSTGSGDIDFIGSAGVLNANTGSGDIDVSNHRGTVSGSTGSGDIDIITDELCNNVTYSTGSGDISIRCRRLSSDLRLSSGTGDVDIHIEELCADVTAKTASGDVDVLLGRDSDAKFVMITGRHGTKRNEFTERDAKTGNSRENARYKVTLETHMGDILVRAI